MLAAERAAKLFFDYLNKHLDKRQESHEGVHVVKKKEN